jgi:Na+/H+ antiporter NhaD/arsenite permease-like protein
MTHSRNDSRPSGRHLTVTLAAPPPVYAVAPFVAMLLTIAICPLVAGHWWESNRNKLVVSLLLATPVLAVYLPGRPSAIVAMAEDYVSFIILLSGLFVISGGILLRGDLEATPFTNAAFLGAGAVLASCIGTTGASMLLIRPLLQTNAERARVSHTVIFFIFLVSNIGGMLTPLGDPPLFLGYLEGVPFAWTFGLWRHWALMVAALLAAYFVWDTREYSREPLRRLALDRALRTPLSLHGAANLLGLLAVVLAVALVHTPAREALIIAAAGVSLWLTPSAIRRSNGFAAYPMIEVAVVFFGIFATMIPALELLRMRGSELGVREPWQFFWASGALSSFLDNAPTYLTFLALGQGLGLPADVRPVAGVPESVLAAISVGSVAMGANSYIGNAPNFMVKSIAEGAGVRMPTFFGYMLYSGLILLPLFALVTLLFFR